MEKNRHGRGTKNFCGDWRKNNDWKKSDTDLPLEWGDIIIDGKKIGKYKDVYVIFIKRWINDSKGTLKNAIKNKYTTKHTQLTKFKEGVSKTIKKAQKAAENKRFPGWRKKCADAVWNALEQYIPELATEQDDIIENEGKKISVVFTSTKICARFLALPNAAQKMGDIINKYIGDITAYRRSILDTMERITPIVIDAHQQHNTGEEKHK